MVRNYLKITLRNLFKHRLHTFILIFGLAISMTACLLILEYVSFELSFDRFHQKSDQIYRVINDRYQSGEQVQIGSITYPTIGAAMKNDFPEVINNTRIFYTSDLILSKDEQVHRTGDVMYIDEQFFNIFDYKILAGSRENLMQGTNQVVLSASLATRMFGNQDWDQLIGNTFQMGTGQNPLEVVAICEDLPQNSYFQAELLVSYPTWVSRVGESAENSWTWSDYYHFLELAPGTDVAALESKFDQFSEQYFRGEEVSGAEERFLLQALEDVHLYSKNYEYEIGQTSNGSTVWVMLLIALFILILAWVNYINLSSARAIERSKEVGVRAVLGAKGRQLISQFITEASLINIFSLGLAFLLAKQVQPYYNQLLGLELSLNNIFQVNEVQYLLLLLIGILFVSGIIISGIYPALLLSGQKLALVLKGKFQKTNNSRKIRQGLVIFQFAASIVLISGTWLVYQQVRFMNQQDLGILTDQILEVSGPSLTPFDSTFIDRIQTLKTELSAHPGIEAVTTSSRVPTQRMGRIFGLRKLNQSAEEGYTANFINVDFDYAKTYGLDLIAGKDLEARDHDLIFDNIDQLLVNEALVNLLGYEHPEKAIGQTIVIQDKQWTIKGVLANFHQKSLHHPIEPIVFNPLYNTFAPFSVRLADGDLQSTIQHIQGVYQDLFPGNIFEYQFLDSRLNAVYESDQRFGRILSFFTVLALLIAGLGLLGLASYTAYLRTKEISIRKILGASLQDIVVLLSVDFLKLIAFALIIGTPIAWYLSQQWLQNFEYHIKIQWWVFLLSGILATSIALFITGTQAIRVNVNNPAKALRND